MYHIKDEGPILVVCFTNHALDQFLEGMLKFTTNMLRVGGRCQNPALQQFTVRELRRRFAGTRSSTQDAFQMQRDTIFEMRGVEENVAWQKVVRDGLAAGYGVLSREAIVEVDPEVALPPNFDASVWLGLASDRAAEFSERFVDQVLGHEKRYLTAR
jgi:hypothetical protein